MLLSIVSNTTAYPLVFIADNLETAFATPALLRTAVAAHSPDGVAMVCVQRTPSFYRNLFRSSPNIALIDENSNYNSNNNDTNTNHLQQIVKDTAQASALIVDDVAGLAARYGERSVAAMLSRCSRQSHVMGVVHRDALTATAMSRLTHSAHAVAVLFGEEEVCMAARPAQPRHRFHFVAECTAMGWRVGAKLTASKEHFLLENGAFRTVSDPFVAPRPSGTNGSGGGGDDTPEVPFKLGLSEKERNQKDAVALPYETQGRELAAEEGETGKGEGRGGSVGHGNAAASILYDPSEEYDLEDPDDDLDI